MRSTSLFFLLPLLLLFTACQKQTQDDGHDIDGTSSNQALYEEVMGIHDEVMPKMNDLHKAKTSLRNRLDQSGVSESERLEINNKISGIDSASEGMMVWMRQFNPIPDSVGEDKARAYLESELVKVKKVKENILAALRRSGSSE